MEDRADAGNGIDSWLIGRLRQQPRRARGEDVVEQLLKPHEAPDVLNRLEELEDAIFELGMRLEAIEIEQSRPVAGSAEAEDATEPPPGYTLFVASPTGYEIVEAEGVVPPPGAGVTLGAHRYTVVGERRTPLPLDRRPCLVLAPTADAPAGRSE